VVSWNGYDEGQKSTVWQRLRQMQAGSTLEIIEIIDHGALARELQTDGTSTSSSALAEPGLMVYEVLRRWARSGRPLGQHLPGLGLRPRRADLPLRADALLRCIDQEFYLRALAVYEHSYRRPPR
jgi:hypothetical protein